MAEEFGVANLLEDLEEAIEDLATIPYFPTASGSAVMRELTAICPDRESLKWLVAEAKQLKVWPGLGGLRELLSTRYGLADEQSTALLPPTPEEYFRTFSGFVEAFPNHPQTPHFCLKLQQFEQIECHERKGIHVATKGN